MSRPLSELQRDFLSGILTESTPDNLGPHSRFGVYSRAYRIRLRDSLEEDFPETLAGIPHFESLLNKYIEEHPSSFWTVGEFAKYFPAFIRRTFPGEPELAFLAELEWARWVAASIGDPFISPPVTSNAAIRILVNPSLQIVQSESENVLVYFAGGKLREERVSLEDVLFIKESLSGKDISDFTLSEDLLIKYFTYWSTAGVIIGFKEMA